MRESNTIGSKAVTLMDNGSSNQRKEIRSTTNGDVTSQLFPAFNRHWLRLVRTGNNYRGYTSFNGTTWFLKFSHTFPMNACLQIGMVVNGYTADSDVIATFNNVSVNGVPVTLQSIDNSNIPAQTSKVSAYPNPSNGQINIDLNNYIDQRGSLEILDVDGQVVYLSLIHI